MTSRENIWRKPTVVFNFANFFLKKKTLPPPCWQPALARKETKEAATDNKLYLEPLQHNLTRVPAHWPAEPWPPSLALVVVGCWSGRLGRWWRHCFHHQWRTARVRHRRLLLLPFNKFATWLVLPLAALDRCGVKGYGLDGYLDEGAKPCWGGKVNITLHTVHVVATARELKFIQSKGSITIHGSQRGSVNNRPHISFGRPGQ